MSKSALFVSKAPLVSGYFFCVSPGGFCTNSSHFPREGRLSVPEVDYVLLSSVMEKCAQASVAIFSWKTEHFHDPLYLTESFSPSGRCQS